MPTLPSFQLHPIPHPSNFSIQIPSTKSDNLTWVSSCRTFNTSITMTDGPQPKWAWQTSTTPPSIGQTTHSVEQDGYGKHIHPTVRTILIPYTTAFVHGELVWSLWVDIDFSDMDKKPYVIPYWLLQFWIGDDPTENSSLINFNKLNNAAYGITWHSFSLSIYNQATTRKRLLTQSSTTYETIDFETSQNLLLLTDTNQTHKPSVTWPSEFYPPGHKYLGDNLQQGTFYPLLEELSTGHTKTFTFTPELPDHQCSELLEIENTGMHCDKMFPLRQHTVGVQTFDTPITSNTSRTNYISTDIQYSPHSLPHILSEHGHMKFIYRR